MSSRSTGTSSFRQRYCCLSREPQALCSRLNQIARLASVAEKTFTGIDTSPYEIVSDAIDRAAMFCLRVWSRLRAFPRALQGLFALQRVGPAVARLRQALLRRGH